MGVVKKYKMKAAVNGPVWIEPRPMSMRIHDKETPILEVTAVYFTHDGKQRVLDLSDMTITFETVTPSGGQVVVGGDDGIYITKIRPADGQFVMRMPDLCRDAIGESRLAYFRFQSDDGAIYSTGNFGYSVVRDLYSYPNKEAHEPSHFHEELETLKDGFQDVKDIAKDAVQKAGDARAMAEEASKEAKSKQNLVPEALDGNVAVFEKSTTVDGGISVAEIVKNTNQRHSHDNKGVLNQFRVGDGGRVSYGDNGLVYQSDLPENMDVLEKIMESGGDLYFDEEQLADQSDLAEMEKDISEKIADLDEKIKALSETEDEEQADLANHIADALPHRFIGEEGRLYRYGFGVDSNGRLQFYYEMEE